MTRNCQVADRWDFTYVKKRVFYVNVDRVVATRPVAVGVASTVSCVIQSVATVTDDLSKPVIDHRRKGLPYSHDFSISAIHTNYTVCKTTDLKMR